MDGSTTIAFHSPFFIFLTGRNPYRKRHTIEGRRMVLQIRRGCSARSRGHTMDKQKG